MNAQFQSLFENVCRCFGHTPTNGHARGGGEGELSTSIDDGNISNSSNSNKNNTSMRISQVNSQASSVSGKRRINRLELNDKQYDELFDKAKKQQERSGCNQNQHQNQSVLSTSRHNNKSSACTSAAAAANISNSSSGRKGGSSAPANDHETAQAVAQAKLAANPPRYRPKRKRSSQTREEIFRNKNNPQHNDAKYNSMSGCGAGRSNNNSRSKTNQNGKSGGISSSFKPQTDFTRLLNPSLALCFATPIRGTEEFENNNDEQDLRSVDNSDTATLNTNGEDTITSTLYFDSKYAHIQESQPPMPLYNHYKLGQAKDEIRTIMATDSHSSVHMIKIRQENEQQQQQQQQQKQSSSDHHHPNQKQQQQKQQQGGCKGGARMSTSTGSDNNNFGSCFGTNSYRVSVNSSQRNSATSLSRMSQRLKKDTISSSSNNSNRNHHHHCGGSDPPDEEMEDAVPDVKAVSSSTDSSRLSNNIATRHGSS